MSDPDTFSVVTDFMTEEDMGRLNGSSRTLYGRVDPILIGRKMWGPEVLGWPKNRRDLVKRMWFDKMDRPLEQGELPADLTHLSFRYNFDQPLATGILPASLTHLTFG